MLCSKIGGECPHPVRQDKDFVFVMMPFKDFDNIYDAIQVAVHNIEGKNFTCERADENYTHLSIWCRNICTNIRRAKYLVVDTTGKNANVFYELGFSHALPNTRAILITQDIKEAPFDIADLNHIQYSKENLKKLRVDLQKAILTLEAQDEDSYAGKSPDEIILDLKAQVLQEESRTSGFKKELIESEDRERELKQYIKEIEAIRDNPVQEAKNKIAGLEGMIAELKTKLKFTEENNREEIEGLEELLEEKEKKLKTLDAEFKMYGQSKDKSSLSSLLLADTSQTIQQSNVDMRTLFHQIMAPLNALSGHVTNLAEGITPKDRGSKKLRYINTLVKMTAAPIRAFQILLDIEANRLKPENEWVPDLRSYLIGYAVDYQLLLYQKALSVNVTAETASEISVDLDKFLFGQVIISLLDNAVKYSFSPVERAEYGFQPKPSSLADKENVQITAVKKNKMVEITISSCGISISDDERKRIFEKGFRGKRAEDRAPNGSGFGLFLAKEIVTILGGSIELIGDTPEYNTIFKITLPVGSTE